MNNRQVDLSDVSDEEIDIYIPQPEAEPTAEPNQLIIDATQEEMMDFSTYEQPQEQHRVDQIELDQAEPIQVQQQTKSTKSKAEQQRWKNMKLKWKQQNRPEFQNKIKRPIYRKYDYRKIRAQLLDDQIFTSHQITINRRCNEVIIGFKSKQERERATKIIKINYFTKSQYYDRWFK
jgi:hypothetical protein